MKIAVIDMGTNTFNLLIANVEPDGFSILHNSKAGVAIGMGGINQKTITIRACLRAENCFKQFKAICLEYQVDQICAIATSAIRDASNGKDFVDQLSKRFKIPIQIICGKEEARLIYLGVSWLYTIDKPSIIMDIGGGSTEFIRVHNKDDIQTFSFNIGVSRAFQLFELSDPLSQEDQVTLIKWFEEQTPELNEMEPCEVLIGASGSFETFYEMIHEKPFPTGIESLCITREEMNQTINWILNSTLQDREKHPFILPIRRKMAPIAALKTKWILEKFNIQEIIISPCSLKEGVLREMIMEKNLH